MATSRLEKVDEFLTCTICSDNYTDPCTLHCQHTFCRKCITRYTKTRPEALQSKTVPCPCCRQVTKVPDPTKPVDEWAKQLKPSIIIQGLIDTSQPGQAITGRCCNLCEHLGETAPATAWCPDCEVALCGRCSKTHRANPASSDHDVSDISAEGKVRRRRKVMCREHEKNCLEFHCKDCNTSACQKCCVIYHRACKSVVDIESMRQDLTSDFLKKRDVMSKRLKRKYTNITRRKTAIEEASQTNKNTKSQIQTVSQRVIDKIKQKEKQLMDKLDEVTEQQIRQLQAGVKTDEIDIQMYRQHCEFIDQAVKSESVMDMYDMYQASESGALVFEDIRDTDTTDSRQIYKIRLKQEPNKMRHVLTDLYIGEIDVTYQGVSINVESSPVLHNTIDTRIEGDKNVPDLVDIITLTVDDVQTCVVTDNGNKSLKSFFTRRNKPVHSKLSFKKRPWGVTQLYANQVMVAVPDSSQIVTVSVTPDLTLFSTIKTNKKYYALAFISPSSLAAGSWFPDYSVDILNMKGLVMKSVSTQNNVELFSTIESIYVNTKGNILVSGRGKKNVTCLTSSGDVMWQNTHGKSTGITTIGNDDILLAARDPNQVIQLTETGQFVREVIISTDGLSEPKGIYMDTRGHLFVCDKDHVKEFVFE